MFFIKDNKKSSGYSLAEIIIVIAIIATLSSIIYTSFDGAKAQSRDQQRLADISNIQLALELYFNRIGQYPESLDSLVNSNYLSSMPKPPSKSNELDYKYNYVPLQKENGNGRCISYHLWTTFEKRNINLESKKGFNSTEDGLNELLTVLELCGNSSYPIVDASSDERLLVYDVTP